MQEEGFPYKFWHEYNSLRFIDDIETLPNQDGLYENLNLTYAVRDGIVSHCGEVDENSLIPRKDYVNLRKIQKGQYMPFTYEGCVVKVSDKIAYLGRDLQDAALYNFFSKEDYATLRQIAENIVKERKIRPFISIEDLQKRAKISSTIIEKMRMMGILDGMDESSQLSLF